MTTVLAHFLAVYVVLCAPWLAWLWYRKAKRRIAAGIPDAKLRFYRELVAEQILTTAVTLLLCFPGGIRPASLGLGAPSSWLWNTIVTAAILTFLVWSGWQMRPKAAKIREVLEKRAGALVPNSLQERQWFGAVSVGAGISEELMFRGFLFYYLATYVPHINTIEKIVLTSLIFGFAHFYQGWKAMPGPAVLGAVFAGFYVLSGSLLLPMAAHAVTDLRVLLMLPPDEPQALPAEANA